MDRIIIFDHNINNIGLCTRHVTQGEEFKLVQDFIDYYIHMFLQNNKKNNLAVFIEPKIASGFPDIVFASYSTKILDNWSDKREKLTINELKVMAHLIMSDGCTGRELMSILKLSEKVTIQAIENLLDAKMIQRLDGKWRPVNMKKIYNIKKLISIEAKMTDMKKVAEQSLINTWFASQSYALISIPNPQNNTIRNFQKQGTGLYCKRKRFEKIVEAQKLRLPSYISLQFNEWIGNTLAHQY